MSNKLKISADTSEVKKSILDIGKAIKGLKDSNVSIFSNDDKKFLRTEFKREIGLIKERLKQNRDEIKKMVDEQKKLVAGTQEELENRKKILEAYKTQAKLGRQLGSASSAMGGAGGGGGILESIGPMLAGLGVAAGAFALMKNIQAVDQYKGGTPARNRLKGLGVHDENFGSAGELARVGLTEQDMIGRRVEATSILGRQGTSQAEEMRKAGFERAFGLEGGTMTGVAAQFRGQAGGRGATDMQMKLQASVIANGIEDAIGPYLQSAVQLLTSINEEGTSNTAEMTQLMAELASSGQRTPEQLAKNFMGVNSAVKGSTGEANAFLQSAFAKAGIGGGTIGGTQFALSSGGIMGMNKSELEKRGYSKEQLESLEKMGMFTGVGARTNAIMDMFKTAGGGVAPGKAVGNNLVGLGNMANSVFGTKGAQGYDVLKMLDQVKNKHMTEKQFDEQLNKMLDSNDPSVKRLDKINSSLSGQTELLTNIDKNLAEALGKTAVGVRNAGVSAMNVGTQGMIGVEKAGIQGFMGGGASILGPDPRSKTTKDKFLDILFGNNRYGFRGDDKPEGPGASAGIDHDKLGKAVGEEVAKALQKNPIVNQTNVKTVLPDGNVTERATK